MAIKKVLATNVEQGGWLGRVVETDKGEKVFLQGRKIRAGDNPTPSNFSSKAKQPQVTPAAAGNISQQQGSSLTRNLPQFTQALQQAMDEAGKHRQARMSGQAFSALGGVPGSASGIVNMIKQSVGPDVEQVFTGTLGAVSRQAELEQREREFQMRLRGQNIDLLSNLAESGVVSEMPNSALQSMAQKAGISSDTALAWKARIMEADKRGEEDRALENQKIRAEIAALGRRNRGGGGGGDGTGEEEGTTFDPITLSYADRVENDPEFTLENVPSDSRSAVSSFLFQKKLTGEANTVEGISNKIRAASTVGTTVELTNDELRIMIQNDKENEATYEEVLNQIKLHPIEQSSAHAIAAEVYGRVPQSTLESALTEEERREAQTQTKENALFNQSTDIFGGFQYQPPDFSNFPSIFSF